MNPWTSEPPTAPGWYWYLLADQSESVCMQIKRDDKGRLWAWDNPPEKLRGQWGPAIPSAEELASGRHA